MVLEAARKWNIDLGQSLMIGDSELDRELAQTCGMRFVVRPPTIGISIGRSSLLTANTLDVVTKLELYS
jgi:histidinol phosphatase-like enzyme